MTLLNFKGFIRDIKYTPCLRSNLSSIVLAWYESAEKHKIKPDKITKQKFNVDYVKEKITEISNYQMTALHWNTSHFQNDFESIYLRSVNCYQKIAQQLQVKVHPQEQHLKALDSFKENNVFSLNAFKEKSLSSSQNAANREVITNHELEYLDDGSKGIFYIYNYLGGEYHLTVDEVYKEGEYWFLQESKNNSKGGKLPSDNDIKDGLFKLILFSNLERLLLNNEQIQFITRLKITGNLKGELQLPNNTFAIEDFSKHNQLTRKQQQKINLLNQETQFNNKLGIIISGNQP